MESNGSRSWYHESSSWSSSSFVLVFWPNRLDPSQAVGSSIGDRCRIISAVFGVQSLEKAKRLLKQLLGLRAEPRSI
jgi:hypothetical protein